MDQQKANGQTQEILIGELDRSAKVRTKIRIVDFRDRRYLDIRDYFKFEDNQDFKPTKRGVAIPIGMLSDTITLLEKAEAALQQASQKP